MYGVSADIDLSLFVGSDAQQICVGLHDLQLHFHSGASISIWSTWRLTDRGGNIIDAHREHAQRESYAIHRLLGVNVTRAYPVPPHEVHFEFEDGHHLTVFEDKPEFECFCINPGELIV